MFLLRHVLYLIEDIDFTLAAEAVGLCKRRATVVISTLLVWPAEPDGREVSFVEQGTMMFIMYVP